MASKISDRLFPAHPRNVTPPFHVVDIDKAGMMFTKVLDDIFFADEEPVILYWGYYMYEPSSEEVASIKSGTSPSGWSSTGWSSKPLSEAEGVPPGWHFVVANFDGLRDYISWRWE